MLTKTRHLFHECVAVVAAIMVATVPARAAQTDLPPDNCAADFGPHLVKLRAAVGDAMGQPVDCEHAIDGVGDTMQTTSTGAAWYTAGASSAMFTDGYQRWILDAAGLTYWQTLEAAPLLLDGLPDGPATWTREASCAVLYTHEVPDAATFRRFVTGLVQSGFRPVSFAVVDASMRGEGELPPGCIVLSFDDALASQLRNAVPVLTELDIVAMFFVMPAFQDGRHTYLDAAGIRALHDAGQIVGAHTCNHPTLPLLSTLAMIAELSDCKHQIEAIIGAPVRYLAYPNGAANQPVLEETARAGYRAAFTTRPSARLRPDQPLQLPRFRYDPGEGASAVAARLRAVA